jgi:hypothetical protein
LNSVLELMALDLAVPDHTTLSRRARTWKPSSKSNDRQSVADGPIHVLIDSTGLKIYGAGQWLEEKHGAKSRRGWRKLHLAVDADGGEIIAHSLTNQGTGDVSQLEPLLDQIDEEICQMAGSGLARPQSGRRSACGVSQREAAIDARPAVVRAREAGRDHSFKRVNDEETKRALFPSNYPATT